MPDYFESGFCVRERSWHGKELLLQAAPENWDEARLHAGLMWEPTLVPLFRKQTKTVERPARYNEISGYERRPIDQWTVTDTVEELIEVDARAVVRDDTQADIGTVSGTFQLITHAEMGHIMETILEEPNVRFDTAGSVKGGRQVYCTVLLDEPYEIRGDVDGFGDPVVTLPYFAVLNSHDGTGSCKGVYTQVRVVCANTVQAADADGNRHGAQFVLRHTSGVKKRLEEARDVIAGARIEAARWREMAEALAIIPFTESQIITYLHEFIPAPPAGLVSDRVMANIETDRRGFLTLLDSSTNSAMRGNALGVFNATVEFLDHVRGHRSQDTLVGRQILRAEPMKAKALKLVRAVANA